MRNLILTIGLSLLVSMSFAQTSAFTTSGTNGNVGLNIASTASPAVATWEAMTHDFGTITQNEPVTYIFKVTNTGEEDLIIKNVKPSCGCTVAEFTKEAIAKGETGIVEATYNAKSPGMFTKTITVFTSAEEVPQTLRIKGEVVAK